MANLGDAYVKALSIQKSPTDPTPHSSSKPNSRESLQSGRQGSSNKADAGSRTPSGRGSSEDEQQPQLKFKRRYLEETPGDHDSTPSLSTGSRAESKRGILPSDVEKRIKTDRPVAKHMTSSSRHTSGMKGSTNDTARSSTNAPIPSPNQSSPARPRPPGLPKQKYKLDWPGLVLQPESREISQDQLAAEVKSIYTGLTMVETKCIHIDRAQAATPRGESKITDEHWQAMIALHRTLLHEHHDFFLASQHPSASAALKRLALKYSMPARMWKHGIHSFLELLRHRLPESLEYMLAFIYLAYQMMALLYETVDSFRTTWVECLGDLGRYRMAVEDEDIRDREIWAGVARSWYNKAADTNPAIGRLWHHLAILARPHMVQQLYLYNRSLTSVVPFLNARESIVTILDPVLTENTKVQVTPVDLSLLKINALLFRKTNLETVPELIKQYEVQLGPTIKKLGDRWRETGAFIAIGAVGALYGFGDQTNILRIISDHHRKILQSKDPSCIPPGLPSDEQTPEDVLTIPQPDEVNSNVLKLTANLFTSIAKAALLRHRDKNVLPLLNTVLTFLSYLYDISGLHDDNRYLREIMDTFPWEMLSFYLNPLLHVEENIDPQFVDFILFEHDGRPLPEDWMLRGQAWTFDLFPREWFKHAGETEEEERYMELTSTMKARLDRVLSLAAHLAKVGPHLNFNRDARLFSIPGADVEMYDEGYGSISGDDSPEMREAKEDELQAMQSFRQKLASGVASRVGRQYSSIIADVDVLKDATLFHMLRNTSLPIIIPEQAITDLVQAAEEHSVRSNEAAAALSNVRTALHEYHVDIRIETAEGEDVTEKHMDAPSATTASEDRLMQEPTLKGPIQRVKTMHYAIERIARSGIARHGTDDTELSFRRTDTGYSSNASIESTGTDATEIEVEYDAPHTPAKTEQIRPRPLVITDNKQLRAKADEFGAAALAGWMAKRLLIRSRKNSAAKAQSSPVETGMDIDTPAPEVAVDG